MTRSRPTDNRQILLAHRPKGVPKPEHFTLAETPLPIPRDGEILVRNHHLSVDPAQRGWANDEGNYSDPVPLGTPMRALAVGEVVESRAADFAPGDFVYGWFGWQDYCAATPAAVLRRVVETHLPLTASLGVLGINGLTAHLALHTLGRPRPGDTVLVSTAAGAVGSLVGQLANIAGCRAVGVTGSAAKVETAKARYGYATAIDYRTSTDIGADLAAACPDGIDVFFDNTGGTIGDAARALMNVGGRIVQCGTASIATWEPPPSGPRAERHVLTKRLSWSGFVIFDHRAEFAATAEKLAALLDSGHIVFDEDITHGLERAPEVLEGLYRGDNHGKAIVSLV
ncbi:MAG: NADP-dependent oxidoreductase [Zavarzinia sp.]|nr:NADP-dependent oxidoreductase [Zavarzinia sp.]